MGSFDSARCLDRPGWRAFIADSGQQPLVLHDDAVRSDDRISTDVRAIKGNGRVAERPAWTNDNPVDLEDAVFEGVRLDHRANGCAVADLDHIGIDDLGKAV